MKDTIVLCYHALSPTWRAELSITPQRFERHVALLLDRGYRPARFTDAVRAGTPGRVFAVTFDDAYRSVYELALPILTRLGVPATVFAPTADIGRELPARRPGIAGWLDGPFAAELRPMTWRHLRGLVAAGWEIGSHSESHPHLTGLDDQSLAGELTRSKAACESHLAQPCTSVAYPYGDVDDRVVAAAAAAGYAAGAALPTRLAGRRSLEWPRIGVYQPDDERRFALKVSPAVRRLRSSPLWELTVPARRLRATGGAQPPRAR